MAKLEAMEYESFEGIKQTDEKGNEFWFARDLQNTLQYTQWRNFQQVIDRAMLACKNSGCNAVDHFAVVSKTVKMPKSAIKRVIDYKLTRYACYLIVQNGDSRKEIIAIGQTYFAIQTRRQELADTFNQLDENNKRLVVRVMIDFWRRKKAKTIEYDRLIRMIRLVEEFIRIPNTETASYIGRAVACRCRMIIKRAC